MSHFLIDRRGIQRQKAMTPREFEIELKEIGLPAEAVTRLTRLFEAARYNHSQSGHDADQEALQCLKAIVDAC